MDLPRSTAFVSAKHAKIPVATAGVEGRLRILPQLVWAVTALGCTGSAAQPTVGVTPPAAAHDAAPAGALPSRLVWSDEFGAATLDQKVWVYNTYPVQHGELETYSQGQVSLSGGNLVIRADHSGQSYLSGAISTYGTFSYTYGYLEARIRLPAGTGFWPTFFLYPDSLTRHGYHEIDIVEAKGQEPRIAHQTLGYAPVGHEITWHTYAYESSVDLTQDFHVYGLWWQPGRLTWYVDGVATHTETHNVPTIPMYIILNLAIGGSYPGPPDASTPFPSFMVVDYVRLYR